MAEFAHVPVLLEQCMDGLKIRPGGCYLDGTVGGAGHSCEIAKRLSEEGRLFCLDKDPEAIAAASERLALFPAARVIRGDFRDAVNLLGSPGEILDGALLDLGVSSHQLDSAARGFSYNKEGALDMRMSDSGETAADFVNTASFEQLCRVLREYGEEPFAAQIADKILAKRRQQPIETTLQLAEIVTSALPPAVRAGCFSLRRTAGRTFQALRIAVNDEMGALQEGLASIFSMLRSGGRFCVITFHSVEDRVVKQYFASLQQGCTCPPEFPVCVCGKKPQARGITKKPIVADADECERNRRARSAKLRIIEKI